MKTGATVEAPPPSSPDEPTAAREAGVRLPPGHPVQPPRRNVRVFVFFSLAILLTGAGTWIFADLLWRLGWSPSRTVLIVLFSILFLLSSIGCMHAIFGFFLRRLGGHREAPEFGDYRTRLIDDVSTALIFPIFNEDVHRVFEGVRTVHESLSRTGHIERFDFFILSDSTDPDKWIEEENRWFVLAREFGALERIHYRRRLTNEGKKSGNVRDFLRTWGRRYRYFLVLDADSIMSGRTIVDLVKIMEENPRVGLVQTAPALVNARSAFGRMQQFANRLYGAVFIKGLDYWCQDGGNYWGHNAMIRVEPFMRYCDLPKLPGRKPFGGQILSHDFVEAALLRRENWEVWMAPNLEESYEEGPPAIIENAQRDRRWCQGNLQHSLLLFARGFRGGSRMHLAFGILGYLAGPLWLAFLITSTWILWYRESSGLTDVVVNAMTPAIRMGSRGHALLVFGVVTSVLFLPKILSLIDLALDPPRRAAFGGLRRAVLSTFLETLFSSLHAPVQMLFHTKFVVSAVFGASVRWTTQKRGGDGTAWSVAARQHLGHTLLGIGWGALTWELNREAFWWFLPVLMGMTLSVPLSVVTSRERLGQTLRRIGLFLTPEETTPNPELMSLAQHLDEPTDPDTVVNGTYHGLREAVLDPYVNAIHVALLREKLGNPHDGPAFAALGAGSERLRTLAEKLLIEGPEQLSPEERLGILSDPEVMVWLHSAAWTRSPSQLAAWWESE